MTILRIGTDCGGIEAPIQALKNLKIPYSHEFSSEIDKYCHQTTQANYTEPKRFFLDLTERDHSKLPPIDMYVCGFPCQPFSDIGYKNGFSDARGIIFFHCLETIRSTRPKVFILENVRGLTTLDQGRAFNTILTYLKKLKEYTIHWNILNTKDFGIPQSRSRLYIVGILKKSKYSNIPEDQLWSPIKRKSRSIRSFVDDKDNHRDPIPAFIQNSDFMSRIPPKSVFVNFCFPNDPHVNADKYCPCILTRTFIWCVPKHRKANIRELLELQGFPPTFRQVVSDTQMMKQIGNSMSVNVLEALFHNIFLR